MARTRGFVAPLTFIAKDQPPAQRTAEGEGRVVEWVFFFLSSATKTSCDGPYLHGDGRKSFGKIKGPKVAASPVSWLCSAMPLSTTRAPRGRDRDFKSWSGLQHHPLIDLLFIAFFFNKRENTFLLCVQPAAVQVLGGSVITQQEATDRGQTGVVQSPQPKESAIRSYLTWCKLTQIKCSCLNTIFFLLSLSLDFGFAKPRSFLSGD